MYDLENCGNLLLQNSSIFKKNQIAKNILAN